MCLLRCKVRMFLIALITLFPIMAVAAGEGPEPWSVKIASDGRHIELSYRGQVWVSGLRVRAVVDSRKVVSDGTGVKSATT